MSSCGTYVRVSVCPSVTFVSCVKTSNRIFKVFFTSGSQATLVSPYQTAWQYSDGNPLTGASNADEIGRNRDSERAVNAATGQVLSIRRRRTTLTQLVTLIAGSQRRSLLMAGDDDEMFMTRSLNITPKTTEQSI